jgi:hypothetical protein
VGDVLLGVPMSVSAGLLADAVAILQVRGGGWSRVGAGRQRGAARPRVERAVAASPQPRSPKPYDAGASLPTL